MSTEGDMNKTPEQLAQSAVGLIGEVNRKLNRSIDVVQLRVDKERPSDRGVVWLDIRDRATGEHSWCSYNGFPEAPRRKEREALEKLTFCDRWYRLLKLSPEDVDKLRPAC
jgi:hypothetical protein